MDRFSRQAAGFGMEAMGQLVKMNVLVVGMRGVGVEVAKNLILVGTKAVAVYDPTPAVIADVGANVR